MPNQTVSRHCLVLRGEQKLESQKNRHWASTSTCWHFWFGAMMSYQQKPCTDCKSAQQCTTRGHLLPFPQLTSRFMQQYGNGARDRQTYIHTDRQTHRWPWPIHISFQLCLTRNVTKNNTILILHLFARTPHRPTELSILVCGWHCWRNHHRQILCQSVQGLWSSDIPFCHSHWSPFTNVLHCDTHFLS